jgi:hypothetical protein
MFNLRTLLKMLIIACVFVTMAAAASTPVSNNQPSTAPDAALKTAMQPDLSLKSVISPQLLFTPTQISKINRHGYCRCSCGYPCQTSADCGGASCDPFITCCEREPGQSLFQNGAASSRKDGAPDINIKCK